MTFGTRNFPRQLHFTTVLALLIVGNQAVFGGVYFTSPELRAPAEDLARFVTGRTGSAVEARMGEPDQQFTEGDWVLAGYVKNRNNAVTKALNPEDRAYLDRHGAESFVAVNAGGVKYLVGGGQRGAGYASARIQRSWAAGGEAPLSVIGEVQRKSPVFDIRVGGAGGPHPRLDYSQPKPADYEWAAYARDLAHAGINLTHGVIGGEVVPDEALKEWGLGKILVVPSAPFDPGELRRWRQSNPTEVNPAEDPLASGESDGGLWAPCPATDFGRKAYTEWLKSTLQSHRTLEKLVFQFSDGGVTPTEECSNEPTAAGRIIDFISIVSSLTQEISPDVQVLISTRGLTAADIEELVENAPEGIGFYFDEPASHLLEESGRSQGGALNASQWDPLLEESLRKALGARGDKVILEVSAGDTDPMRSPALGGALPWSAYTRLEKASSLGARGISLAMGGIHPWVYSPNAEVFKEFTWNSEESAEEMVARIAGLDFGGGAAEVLAVWRSFETAFAQYPAVCRAQRLESLVQNGEGTAVRPPTPQSVSTDEWAGLLGEAVPFLVEALGAVIPVYESAIADLQLAQDALEGASYETAKNIRDGVFWAGFHLHLLKVQYQVVRTLNLMSWIPADADATSGPWSQAFHPVYRDSLRTSAGLRDLLFTAPEPLIRLEDEPMNAAALDRKLAQAVASLEQFVGAVRMGTAGVPGAN